MASVIRTMKQIEPAATRGTLISVRDLRVAMPELSKTQFDKACLLEAKYENVSLHYHDYPASLTQTERDQMIFDGERYYVGIALRISH